MDDRENELANNHPRDELTSFYFWPEEILEVHFHGRDEGGRV